LDSSPPEHGPLALLMGVHFSPFPSVSVERGAVCLEHLHNFGDKRAICTGVSQTVRNSNNNWQWKFSKGLDGDVRLGALEIHTHVNLHGWTPLFVEDIEVVSAY
jgi:hypothetical protein